MSWWFRTLPNWCRPCWRSWAVSQDLVAILPGTVKWPGGTAIPCGTNLTTWRTGNVHKGLHTIRRLLLITLRALAGNAAGRPLAPPRGGHGQAVAGVQAVGREDGGLR